MSVWLDDGTDLGEDQKKILLIEEKMMSYVTVSEGHRHPLVLYNVLVQGWWSPIFGIHDFLGSDVY